MRVDVRSVGSRALHVFAVLAVAHALALGALALFTRTAHAGLAHAEPLAAASAVAEPARETLAQRDVHAAPSAASLAATPAVEWGGVLDLQKRLKDVPVEYDATGNPVFVLDTPEGPLRLSPDEFAARLADVQQGQREHGFLYVLFNITTPWGFVWVALGFLGQALFTFRMVLQWYASEKEKRSVIPIGFWWGSLFGGVMLFVYFVWRKDIVGILGQSTGVFVYARNLVLIYRARAADSSARATRARTA
ncbi:MAG: lipid-A-disaccharide synthase N-terminal domain-containing protein [Planctomycetes bacterium]|nr:lipid-A-disaccharide synthase N-terminal domain-containing protein [Planctomycetota bacterium]